MSLSHHQTTELDLMNEFGSTSFRSKNQKMGQRNMLFEQCRIILKKTHESRTPAENQMLLKLMQKSEFLKEMADIQGQDFIKSIMKHAKLEIVDERQVIVEQDQPINYMVIILEGKLGVEKPSFILDEGLDEDEEKMKLQNLSLKTSALIQKLTILAKRERDQIKKAAKFQRKTSLPVSQFQLLPPLLSKDDFSKAINHVEKNILIHEEYGGKERLNGTSFKNRVIALERSTILIFQMNFLFYSLEAVFKVKMSKNIKQLKSIVPFETLQDEKLAEIILNMKLLKRRKNDIIYSQGEDAENIYILLEGELKISKEVDLFKQNPNDFYVDRRRLVRQINNNTKQTKSRSTKKKEDDGVLHFANLTKLYNYRPLKKSIEIGLISSFGLFGEEEVVFHTKRQATIQVNSISASFYEIQFKKILEIIGSKGVDKFKQTLEISISKKILYRQLEVADQIDFQNRTNMNYFYLDEGQSYSSPRKFKLDKINEKVIPKTSRDTTDHAPAYYTTFNFNKMLDKRYNSSVSYSKNKKTSESMDAFQSPNYNPTEEKLVGISHSWNPIEKKVKQQKFVSRKISPIKHQINISQPLIDQQFFKDVAKEQRRINKQFRTIRLSLGKKIK